jgi:hypothetical protein
MALDRKSRKFVELGEIGQQSRVLRGRHFSSFMQLRNRRRSRRRTLRLRRSGESMIV